VNTADIVAASGGVLGMVTYPIPDLKAKLLAFFRMAADRGLPPISTWTRRRPRPSPRCG
jgi:hypothetical protein